MLAEPERLTTLEWSLDHVSTDGSVLIADVRRNLDSFESGFSNHTLERLMVHLDTGNLFMRGVDSMSANGSLTECRLFSFAILEPDRRLPAQHLTLFNSPKAVD